MQQQLVTATPLQAQHVIQHQSCCSAPRMKRVQALVAVLLQWKQALRAVGNPVISPLLYMCPLAGVAVLSKAKLSTIAPATTSCGAWTRWPGTCRRMACASVAWTALSTLRRRSALMQRLCPDPGRPLPAAVAAGCLSMAELCQRLPPSPPPPAPPAQAVLHAQVCPRSGPLCQRQQPRWHLHWPGLREKNLSASGALVRNSVALLTASWCLSCWHSVTRMPYGSRLSAVAFLQTQTPRCITQAATLSPVPCPGRLLDTTSLARTL